jgi:dUTP pyrophosphatase
MLNLKIKKLDPTAILPSYATEGSAAFDISSLEQITILPGQTVKVRTGLAFEVPEGYELEIRPRSGLSLNSKIRLSNSPGTIDSDYRGEVHFILDNLMTKFPNPYTVIKGQRLGQGILRKVDRVEFVEVEELSETVRGEKGFGSSGT